MKTNQDHSKFSYGNKSNKLLGLNWRWNYSTSNPSSLDTPTPIFTINNLQDKDNVLSNRKLLLNKGGIYSFINNTNGKHHNEKSKSLISKPGELNPMFGKIHSEKTRDLMRSKKKKYTDGVGLYDLDNKLIKRFDYASDLAKHLNVSKVTVSKYINHGLVYKDKYYLKVNPNT
jgi:group I intron endonuclease